MRTFLSRSALIAVSLTAVVACASPTAPEDALAVTSTSPRYSRDSLGVVTVSFRISNAGQSTVYLPTCGSSVAALIEQRLGNATWSVTLITAPCYLSFAAGPYRLDPGQAVQGGYSAPLPAGEYRISVPVALSATGEANRTATSDSFRIL